MVYLPGNVHGTTLIRLASNQMKLSIEDLIISWNGQAQGVHKTQRELTNLAHCLLISCHEWVNITKISNQGLQVFSLAFL